MSSVRPARVSWLIPVKNGMPYIRETLASLERQTYRDFEVIVWDNGSTDGTVDEVRQWVPDRLPGRLITNDPRNLGGSRAGLVSVSNAEFCALIDADDICREDRLETQLQFLEDHPEVVGVGSQLRVIDLDGNVTGHTIDYPLDHEAIVDECLVQNPIGNPSFMFRREPALEVGNYDPDKELEDYDFVLRLATRHRLANQPEYLVSYRIRPESYTRSILRKGRMQELMFQTCAEYAADLFGLSGSEANGLFHKRYAFTLRYALRIAKHRARLSGGSFWGRLRKPSLLKCLRPYVRQRDVITRVAFATLDPEHGSLTREFRVFVGGALGAVRRTMLKAVGGERLKDALKKWRRSRTIKAWKRAAAHQGAVIDPSIHFLGRPIMQSNVRLASGLFIEPEVSVWLSEEASANVSLEFGENVYIARNVYIGVHEPIKFGASVLVGAYSYIISGNHRYADRSVPILRQGFEGAPITIEDDVWIGTHVVILPGVTIGRGAIIGAGSVVNRDVPPYEIWAGVPAMYKKRRP